MKKTNTGWSKIQLLGIVLVAAGAAFLAFSIYSMLFGASISSNPGFIRENITNGSGFRTVRSSPGTGSQRIFTGSPTNASLLLLNLFGGDILSGIVIMLLGFVTYKYGSLKKLV